MPNPFHTEQLSPHGLAHVVAGLSQGSGDTGGGVGGGAGAGSVESVHGDMAFDFGSLNIGPSLFQGSLPKEYQVLLDQGQGQGQGQGGGHPPPPSLLMSSPSRLHEIDMGGPHAHATAHVSAHGGAGGLRQVASGIKSLTSLPSGLAFNNSEISHIERMFGISKGAASPQGAGAGAGDVNMGEGAANGGGLLGGGSLVLPVGVSSSLNLPIQMRHLVTTGSGLHNMQSIEQGLLGDKRNL